MSAYKDNISAEMAKLADDPLRRFVGYNVKHGLAGGTLVGVPFEQLIETPVAENLMAGVAVGLSLIGYKPVLYFERFDFILNALDSIVNHMDKMERLSNGEFCPSVIIRVTVGNRLRPLFTGPPHVQDFSDAISRMVSFPVLRIVDDCGPNGPAMVYAAAKQYRMAMVVEYKDLL